MYNIKKGTKQIVQEIVVMYLKRRGFRGNVETLLWKKILSAFPWDVARKILWKDNS